MSTVFEKSHSRLQHQSEPVVLHRDELSSWVSTTPLTRYRNGYALQKSRVTVVNNGKLSKTEGIRHVNGEKIKKVGEEWYKHLGMTEPDRVKENDMNYTLKYEYLRTLKLIMNSKLNGGSKIKAVNI